MCDSCGCGDPRVVPVEVADKILAENDQRAAHNRAHFAAAGVLAINMMGSPGSGKTALLEATARLAGHRLRIAAVSGDLATDHDALRLRAAGIPCASITTGSACHLDAQMVHDALHHTPWEHTDLFFIENVGNLVCPAIYDLGQAVNVVVLAATEGVDKPLKYPVMFQRADVVVLSKCDLLPHLPQVDVREIEHGLARVSPMARLIQLSAVTGAGIDRWVAWLDERVSEHTRAMDRRTHTHHPHHHHHF